MSGGTGPVGNHRRAARLSGLQLVDQLVHAGVALRRATALKSGDGLAGQPEQANGHAGVASESGRRRSAA